MYSATHFSILLTLLSHPPPPLCILASRAWQVFAVRSMEEIKAKQREDYNRCEYSHVISMLAIMSRSFYTHIVIMAP